MKKFSKKSVVVFAGVMAVCALAMPSMASALVWSPVGGASHPLTSTNLSFITEGAPAIGWSCAASTLTGVVPANGGGTDATITSTSFTRCMGIAAAVNCTLTPVGLGTWTVTATTPLQIHGVHVTFHFENTPSNPTACAIPITITLTGTLTGGHWNNVEHGVTLTGATGLTGHVAGMTSAPVTVSGTITDPHSASKLTLS